jgi:L-alanine-DL-glutamate epimerase-like enolase superfamily enzyme
MARIKSINSREIVRPLKTFFATALGRKAFLQNVLVSVLLDDGSVGVGEIPTSFSRRDETVPVMKQVLQRVRTDLINLPIDAYGEQVTRFRERFPYGRMTISGLEVALFRAFLKSAGSSERAFFGARLREVETDITIPFVPDEASLATWIDYAARKGFRTLKAKVSGNLEEDKRFLSLICGLIEKSRGPFRLRLDGNQGFTVSSFFDLMDFVHKKGYPVELFEQPLRKNDLAGFRTITKAALLPIILDESVENFLDAARAIEARACDGINVKLAKSGIRESLDLVRLARKHGLKLMIGCMTETMAGLSAAIYWAAGGAAFDYIDLDGVYLLHHRNRYGNITIEGPKFVID